MLQHQLTDCMICRGVVAPLGQESAVIVACDGRKIVVIVVGTGSEAEISPSVEHVEIETRVAVKKILYLLDNAFRLTSVMLSAPVVEPAAPEFRTHLRSLFTKTVKGFEIFFCS